MYTTYEAAFTAAQSNANNNGFSYGLEKLAGQWHVFMLPRRENRSGHELTCQEVRCMDASRIRAGY